MAKEKMHFVTVKLYMSLPETLPDGIDTPEDLVHEALCNLIHETTPTSPAVEACLRDHVVDVRDVTIVDAPAYDPETGEEDEAAP
jgi:hypothetical protein